MPSDENSLFSQVLKIHLNADLSDAHNVFGLENRPMGKYICAEISFRNAWIHLFPNTQLKTNSNFVKRRKIVIKRQSGFGVDFTKFNGSIPINFHYLIQWCIDEIDDSNPILSPSTSMDIAQPKNRETAQPHLQATNLMKARHLSSFGKLILNEKSFCKWGNRQTSCANK